MKINQKIKVTGIMILTMVFTFFIVSCRRASEKTGEKMIEKAIENATGQKADVDLSSGKAVFETGEGKMEVDSEAKSWPDDIPDDVPEFTFGKVKGVTTSTMNDTKTWNVMYEEVQDGFIDQYDALLKEKGFETVIMKMGDKGGSIQAENDKYNVFLMGGEETLSVGVSLKKPE